MFSRRTGWDLTTNRLAAAIEERRRSGKPVLDLTVSNPTAVGLAYPAAEISEALSGGVEPSVSPSPCDRSRVDAERRNGVHLYHPHPLGEPAAREAVAASYAERGIAVDPHQIVLTASTSEAYAWIFKLLCDPGDRVLVPRPSYPLFEFLATLESVAIESYPLRHDARWEIDFAFLVESLSGEEGPGSHGSTITVSSHAARPKARGRSREGHARAIVLVNPNNPTGSYVSRSDLDRLAALAAEHALPLVSDEVFSTYPLDPPPDRVASLLGPPLPTSDGSPGSPPPIRRSGSDPRHGTTGLHADPSARVSDGGSRRRDGLLVLSGADNHAAFVLDGLSKSAGMPGMKLGWIVVCGPPSFRDPALARLEMIADTYLSVGTPVQRALPRLFEIGREIHAAIAQRTAGNLSWLKEAVGRSPAAQLLGVEGGWSAVLRLPATQSEEDWCIGLASEEGVFVQPGWFFDFDREVHLVVSLLAQEAEFREGVARILERVARDT